MKFLKFPSSVWLEVQSACQGKLGGQNPSLMPPPLNIEGFYFPPVSSLPLKQTVFKTKIAYLNNKHNWYEREAQSISEVVNSRQWHLILQ